MNKKDAAISNTKFDEKKFIELLKDQYDFPCFFMFKCIVKKDQKIELENFINKILAIDIEIIFKPSKKGNYLSATFKHKVESAKNVIDIYNNLYKIEGIITL